MTEKIAISLPDEAAAWMRTKVANGQAPNVSAGIAALIEADRKYSDWLRQEQDAFGEALPSDPEHAAYWTSRLLRTPAEVRADNEREFTGDSPA